MNNINITNANECLSESEKDILVSIYENEAAGNITSDERSELVNMLYEAASGYQYQNKAKGYVVPDGYMGWDPVEHKYDLYADTQSPTLTIFPPLLPFKNNAPLFIIDVSM